MSTSSSPSERTAAAIFFSGSTYFIHFLGLGFASFPLQTHLRQVLTPASASLVASLIPIAACMTYFFFRFADARGWTRSPQRVLFFVAVGVAAMQCVLGWRLRAVSLDQSIVAPAIDVAICLLMLGCVQSSCMTLLNHIGVATMGTLAYTVRAAGSAGYMVALILMGLLEHGDGKISEAHLYVGATISLAHACLAFASALYSENLTKTKQARQAISAPECTTTVHQEFRKQSHDKPTSKLRSKSSLTLEWAGLLVLVWMVAMCEMSYGLYSHEFLTKTYGNFGYFVFAIAVGIEIALLVAMPLFPRFKQQLLFVGPVGWIMLFSGCLIAVSGWQPMGVFAIALALNCPFQISANEHAHRMNSSIMGVASMTLAQSLGYVSATFISATISKFAAGPAALWSIMIPVSIAALSLSTWKLRHSAVSEEAPGVRILDVHWSEDEDVAKSSSAKAISQPAGVSETVEVARQLAS